MGVNSLPKTVTRQRRDCDLYPGPSAPESSTQTTRLSSHHIEDIMTAEIGTGINGIALRPLPSTIFWIGHCTTASANVTELRAHRGCCLPAVQLRAAN